MDIKDAVRWLDNQLASAYSLERSTQLHSHHQYYPRHEVCRKLSLILKFIIKINP